MRPDTDWYGDDDYDAPMPSRVIGGEKTKTKWNKVLIEQIKNANARGDREFVDFLCQQFLY